MTNISAFSAFRPLLDGRPPDPTVRDLGPFTDAYLALSAEAPKGQRAVRQLFDRLAASDPNLANLMAGSASSDSQRDGRLRLLDIEDLERLPPVRYIDERRELPANALTILYGPYGVGKTFVALDYALRVAQSSQVVYVAAEGIHGMCARVRAWCSYHALEAGRFLVESHPLSLIAQAELDELIELIVPHRPVLVVIDPLARVIPGLDENDAGAMGRVVEACDQVRLATGAALLLLHHSGKNGDLRGSSALPCAADQLIRLAPCASGFTLKCEKAKDSAGFEDRRLCRLQVPTGRQQDDGLPETSCVIVPLDDNLPDRRLAKGAGELTRTRQLILEALADPGLDEMGTSPRKLAELTALGESTVAKHLPWLKNAGWVSQERKNGPYRLAQEGRDALAGAAVSAGAALSLYSPLKGGESRESS